MQRRRALQTIAAASAACLSKAHAEADPFAIDYVLASALYGDMKLETILPEVARTGAIGLDLWGKPHGTQREEIDTLGVEAFAELLAKHETKLTVSTRYPLGCFGLQPEMPVLQKLGGRILVCGSSGPKDPEGEEAEKAMKDFLEKMRPHADAAAAHDLVIAVENHANQALFHPDSIRYFAEFNDHPALGIAFAPHHLHAFTEQIPDLIRTLGKKNLPFIYFQEHGIGSQKTVAKEIELEQLPGRGMLDYTPIVQALRDSQFGGVAEIFMHPTPRGTPVLETASAITDTLNESRTYLTQCIARTH
jgi:sugar phosphate isomerase/epimerase